MDQSSGLHTPCPGADAVDLDAIGGRGLFHDLEHGMTTVRFIVDAVRGDPTVSEECRTRLASAARELTLLCEVVDDWLAGLPDGWPTQPVRLGSMAEQLATLMNAEHETAVVVLPGPQLGLAVSPAVVWRLLSNVVGNAVRAAGADGHVWISVRRAEHTGEIIVDVTDDGPGFGRAPAGRATLGLRVVTSLLATCGGRLVRPDGRQAGSGRGTTIELVFPARLGIDPADDTGTEHTGRAVRSR